VIKNTLIKREQIEISNITFGLHCWASVFLLSGQWNCRMFRLTLTPLVACARLDKALYPY